MHFWKQPVRGSKQHLDSPGQSESCFDSAESPQRTVLLGSGFIASHKSGSGVSRNSKAGHFPGFSIGENVTVKEPNMLHWTIRKDDFQCIRACNIVLHCFELSQHCSTIDAKNRRCKSSRVTPPLGSLSNHDGDGKENATVKVNSRGFKLHRY